MIQCWKDAVQLYSSHSLQCGLATWAASNGWDGKTLMEYVDWKDVQSTMRYVDEADPFAKRPIEKMMEASTLPK